MKFLLSMHINPALFAALTEEERNEIMTGHGAFVDTITKSGELIITQALADPSQSAVVRVRNGLPAVTIDRQCGSAISRGAIRCAMPPHRSPAQPDHSRLPSARARQSFR